MEDQRDDLIFFEELSPERREAVREAIGNNAELARTVAQWRQIRATLRHQIEARVPDRRLLVLYALDAAGRGDVLSADEQADLDRTRVAIEAALDAHPGLGDAVARIQEDQDAFEAAWTAHYATQEKVAQEPSDRESPRRSADRVARSPRTQRDGIPAQRWAWRAGALAAVAVLAVVGVLLFSDHPAQTVIVTGADEVRRVELADGSTVRLMANSRLTYAGSDAADAFDRDAMLETGRAFFDVTPAPEPFVVETPTARTTVRGTSFGVEVQADETRVVLASGRVEVASRATPDRSVALQPGQSSRVVQDAAPTAPESVDVAEALAWTQLFIFRDTPVERIADRLADHYETSIDVNADLRDQAVTGTFEHEQPLADILSAIATTLGAQVVSTEDGYRLHPRTDA
jgi:ferric-dicitrate binding protein FerR (iron transport regulator)